MASTSAGGAAEGSQRQARSAQPLDRAIARLRPERAQQASPNIAHIVFNDAQFEHLKILLLKGLAAMVLFLIQYVILHTLDLGRTDRDPKIAGLPLEFLSSHGFMNP